MTRTAKVRKLIKSQIEFFQSLFCVSVCVLKIKHMTPTHNISWVCVCVCMCLAVCVTKKRHTQTHTHVIQIICSFSPIFFFFWTLPPAKHTGARGLMMISHTTTHPLAAKKAKRITKSRDAHTKYGTRTNNTHKDKENAQTHTHKPEKSSFG